MKINWKVRAKNPTFWLTFAPTLITLIYTLLAIFGVTPSTSEDTVIDAITMLVTLLATLGILVDPTTSGISDSSQAMEYDSPK